MLETTPREESHKSITDEKNEKLREEVHAQFETFLDEKLMEECIKLCEMYNLSGEDLRYKWEAVHFRRTLRRAYTYTMDDILELKARCKSDLEKAIRPAHRVKGNLDGLMSKSLGAFPGKMGFRPGKVQNMPTYGKRNDGFALAGKQTPVAGPSTVRFNGPSTDEESSRSYRYMYEKVSDRSAALDTRIDEMGELVRLHYNIDDLGDPSATTEEDTVVVGRITFDSETSEGSVKLNEASLTLESSRQMGSGARVPLRFDPHVKLRQGRQGAGGIGLFPGAIAALRGKNGGGGSYLVSEILSLPPFHPAQTIKPEGTEPFNVCIACGPFTPNVDMKFEPWHKLITRIKLDRPNAVVLVGPFIDSTHPALKDGEVDELPGDIFRNQFLTDLTEFLGSSPDSQVLIVPSVQDITSAHAVYPQGELAIDTKETRIRLLPNPCRFSLNDVNFGVTSVDVLFHLRKEEFFKRAQEIEPTLSPSGEASVSDMMVNTCRHLLQQRSFYPIFPVPLDLAHEVNLDVTHMDRLNLDIDGADTNVAPDVLILPSRLKQFAKVVDSTIAINPSFLTKGQYASLLCANSGSSVGERIKAEIVRLDA